MPSTEVDAPSITVNFRVLCAGVAQKLLVC